MDWTDLSWLAAIKARIMQRPPSSGGSLSAMRARVEHYRERIDGAAPCPHTRDLQALLRQSASLEPLRQQLARWARLEELAAQDPGAARDQLARDEGLRQLERLLNPGLELRVRIEARAALEERLLATRRRLEASEQGQFEWPSWIREWLALDAAEIRAAASELAQMWQKKPELASTLALLPDLPEEEARQGLIGLIDALATHPPGLPVGAELTTRADRLRATGRLGDLLEILLEATGHVGRPEERLAVIERLVPRVEPRSLVLVLPRLVQHPLDRMRLSTALDALAELQSELRRVGEAADEQLLAERWRTISAAFPQLGQLVLPGQGARTGLRLDERGQLAQRREEALVALTQAAAPDRPPSFEGDRVLLTLDRRVLEGSSWPRWLALRARIEEARDRLSRLELLQGQASPQELLEAMRIAGIDWKSYLPATIHGQVARASAVMRDIHLLLVCLSRTPEDEEALLRIADAYHAPDRPRELAEAWSLATAKELAPGRGTLAQRISLARERKDFVEGVLALRDQDRQQLRRHAELWMASSSLADSTYVRRRVGARLMPNLPGQRGRPLVATALAVLAALLLPLPGLAQTGSGDAAWLEGNDALARSLWERSLLAPDLLAAERDRLCANLRWSYTCSERLVAGCERARSPVRRLQASMSSALVKLPGETPLSIRETPGRAGKELGPLPHRSCFCVLPVESKVRTADGWAFILADTREQEAIRGWSLLDRLEGSTVEPASCPPL